MHPSIRQFSSSQFYDNQICDIPNIENRPLAEDLQYALSQSQNSRMVFFDIEDSEECKAGSSKVNDEEAAFTIDLIKRITQQDRFEHVSKLIGVISPYKS